MKGVPGEDSNPNLPLGGNRFAEALQEERRLLIVDDEPEIVEELALFLRKKGFQCETAFDGEEALSKIKQDPAIAIVLTDIRMPGIDGLELAKKLRETWSDQRDLEVIMLTGHAGIDQAVEALQMGALDFLTKPVSLKYLLSTVQQADKAICMRRLDHQYRVMLSEELESRTAEVKQLLAEVEALRQELLTGHPSPSVDECMKSIFLPGVQYELSPVVETIAGMTALLEEDERVTAIDGADLYLEHLALAAREARVFTDTLSDLMATMCGEIIVSKTPVSLEDVLADVLSVAGPKAAAAGVSLETHIPDDLPDVCGDRGRIAQSLTRILESGVNLAPMGGALALRAEAFDQEVQFRITLHGAPAAPGDDDGEGRSADDVKALTHLSSERLGIGYTLAGRLIQMLGGTLKLESQSGSGPSFVVTLPR